MRDHNDEAVAGNFLEKLHDLYARCRIKRARRLVGKQNIGIVDECSRNRNSLHLSARHLARTLLELIAKSYLGERFFRSCAALCLRDARQRERELDVREHRLVRNEVVALEDEADRVIAVVIPIAVEKFLGRFSIDDKVAVGVTVKTADDIEHRGFSAARSTEDRNEFVPTEIQRNTAEGDHLAVARDVFLNDVF